MLTEYSTYEDLRKFGDKAFAKSQSMMMEEGMQRLLRRKMIEWRLLKRENRQPIRKTFDLDGQTVIFYIGPHDTIDGYVLPFACMVSLQTFVNTKKGLSRYEFLSEGQDRIVISSPHYLSRCRERHHVIHKIEVGESVPYIRNGRKYELLSYSDNVIVCRRPEPDILIYITHLTKDMCTSRNFQGIFAQAGKDIDEHDIYVWK